MVSVVGTEDDVVPPRYSIDPMLAGAIDEIQIVGAGHMDLIDSTHEAWAAVIRVLAG
jgi:hypothetical protein